MPLEYKGSEFGPGVKTVVITLYRDSGMTGLAIERFLKTFGLHVSHGKISSWLTDDNDIFHAEKEDIVEAGRKSTVYQQMDDTGSRVNGKNHYTHVLQFNKIALYHALCWVHEGRHYKKLPPLFGINRKILDVFLDKFWSYYNALLTYKKVPSEAMAQNSSMQFDELFETTTGYDALDKRITMTRAKKNALLLVLDHPFLPLHNNASELGTRVQARIRDINFQTVSENGTKSKDIFATIVQTARKMGVNVYQYINDRVTKKFEMPSLAELILFKVQQVPKTT
jgi:hypothetical protein